MKRYLPILVTTLLLSGSSLCSAMGTFVAKGVNGSDVFYFLGNSPFTPEDDSLELVRLYNATDGPNWQTGWDLEEPMNSWAGVILNNNGQVSSLSLENNLLAGPIIDLQLPDLVFLNLSDNNLAGSLPDFSGLPNLEDLIISRSNLSGSIPDFSNLPTLNRILLTDNQLTGTLADFSNLSSLTVLRVAGNNLEGSIPDFSNLSNLITLSLDNNNFSGSIPDFSNLPNLSFFGIEKNNLSGSIPDFSNLPKLRGIALSENPLTGSLPNFSGTPLLDVIECSTTRLTGPIPDFTNLPLLKTLFLGDNDHSGAIPNFTNLPNLELLFLNGNDLTGAIPDFSNLAKLRELFLDNNNFEGSIPDFSNLPNMINLGARLNKLSGPIPNFANLDNLRFLALSENELSGSLPDFSNLPLLQVLEVRGNHLGDTIPNFSNLPNLETLDLHNNDFLYASKMTDLPFLTFFDVTLNQLTFDDILPNIGLTNFFGQIVNYRYGSQAPIPAVCDTIWAAVGSNLAFRLYFDEELTDNVYEWFRFGQPYLTTQGQNRLNIYDLQSEDTGDYSWRVTNPNVPDLALFVDNVFLQVDEINQDSLNHLRLAIPSIVGKRGDIVCFDIQAEPFDSLRSLDLSMKWDTSLLAFARPEGLQLPDLDLLDFNLSSNLTDKGRLTLSWESITNQATGGESTQETTSLFQLCFAVKADSCQNALLEFTNTPLPLRVSNSRDSCVFFDGRPGNFIANCDEEFRIPEESLYLAQTEYTDTQGWTNYIKKREELTIADTILLGIKKNGREIGDVDDGAFLIEVQKNTNTIDITQQMRNVPGFSQIDQAVALDYWWYVRPNYTFVDADTTFGLSFYFEQEDVERLGQAVGADLKKEDLFLFKVSSASGENACQNLVGFNPDEIQVYTNGSQASMTTWKQDNFGQTSTSLVGTMDLDGFSCGGIMTILQTVAAKEITELESLTLAPNPSAGQLSVQLQLNGHTNIRLRVLNSLGQTVYRRNIEFQAGNHSSELKLHQLSSGIYTLHLQNSRGEQISRKFVMIR